MGHLEEGNKRVLLLGCQKTGMGEMKLKGHTLHVFARTRACPCHTSPSPFFFHFFRYRTHRHFKYENFRCRRRLADSLDPLMYDQFACRIFRREEKYVRPILSQLGVGQHARPPQSLPRVDLRY
jgi:hypothetical protein